MEVPSIGTVWEILQETVTTRTSCTATPWAVSQWGAQVLFWLCILFILFYLYVTLTILFHRIVYGQFASPFYNCVLVLAIGDIGTLLTCSQVSVAVCVLRTIPARYLAWESFTVFCVDLIYGTNLAMALVRLEAVFSCFYPRSMKQRVIILNVLLSIVIILSFTWAFLWFSGLAKKIWFPSVMVYKGELLFPFNFIRTPWSMTELGITFIVYCLACFQLRKVKHLQSSSFFRREYRLLLLAVLIFFCELFFYYTSDWVGSIFGIGDEQLNTNISYFGKPIATGITPIFYLIFSADVRIACLYSFKKKTSPVSSILIVKN